jgi:hypothetical protein
MGKAMASIFCHLLLPATMSLWGSRREPWLCDVEESLDRFDDLRRFRCRFVEAG